MATLLNSDVRTFIFDTASNNVLLDSEEFSDDFLTMCISLAVDSFNAMPPMGSLTLDAFPDAGRVILLYGACWHAFTGKAASYARNSLTYSDGGVQVPIEEKYDLYMGLAGNYKAMFESYARSLKNYMNVEDGWSYVSSDQAMFPYW